MEFNSWGKKLGEIKAYQPREQKFASFGNVNRFVNQNSGSVASGILNSNKGFANQIMGAIDKSVKGSGKDSTTKAANAVYSDLSQEWNKGGLNLSPEETMQLYPGAYSNVFSGSGQQTSKKKGFGGMLSSIGGFFKKGFGF